MIPLYFLLSLSLSVSGELSVTCPPARTAVPVASVTVCSFSITQLPRTSEATVTGDRGGLSVITLPYRIGTTIVQPFNATNNLGDEASCVVYHTMIDENPPRLQQQTPTRSNTCPANLTVECDSIPETPTFESKLEFCDEVQPPVIFIETSDQTSTDNYVVTRTWTTTDLSGNQAKCLQIVTVQDTTPPDLSCPADVTVECDAVPAPDELSAADNCDQDPINTAFEEASDQQEGDSYTITRTWTPSPDRSGNQASACQQTVTVQDTTAPALVGCPNDITVECDSVPSPSSVTAMMDNCDPSPPTVSFVETSDQQTTDSYTITRTWTATPDRSGNQATCQQIVTVQDTTAPTLTGCPADVTVECDPFPAPATVTSADNCDPALALVSFAETTPGDTIRTWTAVDRTGQTSSCQQTLTGQPDATDPVITCPDDITIECSADLTPGNAGTASATDNCDPSPAILPHSDTRTDGSFPNTYVIQREWTALDENGFDSTCTQTINVFDTTDPVLTCPPDITIECSDDSSPAATGMATATDNCDASPDIGSPTDTITPGSTLNNFLIQREWRAVDDDGHSTTCNQIITVVDTTPPNINFCPPGMTFECDGIGDLGMATSSDNCDSTPNVSCLDQNQTVNSPDDYVFIRQWTATDDDENLSTCDQEVVIQDTTPPVITCPPEATVTCDSCRSSSSSSSSEMRQACDIPTANESSHTATDNCDPNPSVTSVDAIQITTLGAPCNYNIVRTGVARDRTGNLATCSSTIEVFNGNTLLDAELDKMDSSNSLQCDPSNTTACIDICNNWANDQAPSIGVVPSADPDNDFTCVSNPTAGRRNRISDICDCKFLISDFQFCVSRQYEDEASDVSGGSRSRHGSGGSRSRHGSGGSRSRHGSGSEECDDAECSNACANWFSTHPEISGYVLHRSTCRIPPGADVDASSRSRRNIGECCFCSIDLDECSAAMDDCAPGSQCTNTLGSYSCGGK